MKLRNVVTLRVTKLKDYETQKFSFFVFYSPRDHDYYLIPEISKKLSDVLLVSAGGSFFGGKQNTFLGQFHQNDNVYLNIKHDF